MKTIGEGKRIIHFAFRPDEDIVAYCENGQKPNILHLDTARTTELDSVEGQSKLALPVKETGGSYGKDPRFVDAAKGDLRLLDSNPLRHAGVRANASP